MSLIWEIFLIMLEVFLFVICALNSTGCRGGGRVNQSVLKSGRKFPQIKMKAKMIFKKIFGLFGFPSLTVRNKPIQKKK